MPVTPFTATYINLSHRTDRRAHMERELARVGITAKRMEALRPDDWRESPEHVAAMLERTPGAVGCMMSQMQVILNGCHRDRMNTLVLEDDVIFCDDFHERLAYLDENLERVDPAWDIAALGATFHVPAVWHKDDRIGRDVECTSDPRILRAYGAWFTYAYIVRAESAEKVLSLLDKIMPVCWGIDHAFILLGDRLRNYAFVPGCAKQMDGRSDIGDGDTIFSGFAALGRYWFQPLMSDFDPESFDWREARR